MTSPKVPIQPPMPHPEQRQDQTFLVRAERKFWNHWQRFLDDWQRGMNIGLAISAKLIAVFIAALFLVGALVAIVTWVLEGALSKQVVTRFEFEYGIPLIAILMVIVLPKMLSRVFDEEMLIDLWPSTPQSLPRARQLAWDAIKQGYQALDYKRHNEAMRFFRKAAVQGYAEAQFNIGIMYQEGKGVPQDYGQARYWYNLAAAQGFELAKQKLATLPANRGGPIS